MSNWTVKLSIPDALRAPTFSIDVDASDENQAIDRAFSKAFANYPQFGAFQVDDAWES
jgi:hypothetical protein